MPSPTVNRFMEYLDKSDLSKIEKLKFEWLRKRAVIAKGLTRLLIAEYLKLNPTDLEFSYNEFGKPYLFNNKNDLQFNISHCDDIVVLAFTNFNDIGVDVERIKEIDDMEGVIDLCFTQYEKNWFSSIYDNSKTETFYKIWTVKEAFIKNIGKGFSFSPRDVELTNESENQILIRKILPEGTIKKDYQVTTIKILSDYIISLVCEGKKDIEIHNWKPD